MSEPKARAAMDFAISSDAEIKKPLPFYEIKSAKDPWASFKLAGQKQVHQSNTLRMPKRIREEDNYLQADVPTLAAPTTALPPSCSLTVDPNDLEFTDPPW